MAAVVNGDGQPAPPRGARPPVLLSYGRPVVAGLLLLLLIVGVRAAGPGVAGRGPWRQHALLIGIGLEAALAALQIALAIRARRSSAAHALPVTLRRDLRRIAAVVMVAIVVVAVANAVGGNVGSAPVHRALLWGRLLPPRDVLKRGGGAGHLGYLVYALLALILLAAIVVCAVVFARMRHRGPAGYQREADDESASLRKAVESGRAALRAVDDARAAIIACYLAMERSLAQAGSARAAAETPDELLTRATATGLLRGPAAGRLTGLFYEARFSSHELADTVKDDARVALEAISAELRRPAAGNSGPGPANRPDRAGTGASP